MALEAPPFIDRSGSPDTSRGETRMKVEELIGSKVWLKVDRFRSVPGTIESMSNAVNLDDIKSSVSQSRFKIELPSGKIVEILGSDISKIEHAAQILDCCSTRSS
jgi:hypothetical protein